MHRLLALLAMLLPQVSAGATAVTGDLIFVDASAFGATKGGIMLIDDTSGDQTLIATGVGRFSIAIKSAADSRARERGECTTALN